MATKRTQPRVWPLGDYLRDARGRMSIREAARRASISESRWRQVEAGTQKVAGEVEVPVHPKPETVAAMCRAVAADVRKGLELAGHDPTHYPWLVSSELDSLPDDVRYEWFDKLPREDREAVLQQLQHRHLEVELQQRGKRDTG